MKTVRVTDYTNQDPSKHLDDGQMDGRTEGRSGPTTRPDFPNVTQVKKHKYLQTIAKANIYTKLQIYLSCTQGNPSYRN